MGKLLLLLAFLVAAVPSQAREVIAGTYLDVPENRSQVLSVQKLCNNDHREELLRDIQFDIRRSYSLGGGGFGIVSRYYYTSIFFALTPSDTERFVLTVTSPTGRRSSKICDRLIVFDPGPSSVKIRPSFKNGDAISKLPLEQREYISSLLSRCNAKGTAASEYFTGGGFEVLHDSNSVVPSNGFSCEAAADNSVASIDLIGKTMRIRVTVVYDRIYLSDL